MCTLENVPRLPEHCVEYVKVKTWEQEQPFGCEGGKVVGVDGDDPNHIMWIASKAQERGALHGIDGITYAFTQGVVKNITPAIASTNAIIASACCNEVLKMATGCAPTLKNYFMYNGNSIDTGVYGQVQSFEPDASCPTSRPPIIIRAPSTITPTQFVERYLLNNNDITNERGDTYPDPTTLLLQSLVQGVLIAPQGSAIAKTESRNLGELNLDNGGDSPRMLIASDPKFWGRGQLRILLEWE